jgi:lipopolysaccharide transport system permease protein
VIQPFTTMVAFSLFFGRLAKMPLDGVSYSLFTYAALVPWTFFVHGLNRGVNSLLTDSKLLKKVYLPQLTIPLSTIILGLIDFAIAFVILLGMMLYCCPPARR